jgi:predicted dehydrogenase/threonine dehydrogenase-like Zn-dependent dehydrogenase
MKQVVQPLSGGSVRVIDVPRPTISSTEVLVRTHSSIISAGTERAVTELARSNLLAKARSRPDLVRRAVQKAKTEGLAKTATEVRARLDEYMPLGYSAAGTVIEVGEHVAGIRAGQLVATGGAQKANHAEFQAVPALLCNPIPEEVSVGDAAFTTIASVALHGLRLAEVEPGSKVVVVGLGLVGQIATRLARAAGCQVVGMDVASFPVERADRDGTWALIDTGEDTTESIRRWSEGLGADAVLVTAGSSTSESIMRCPPICRDRATIVVVGDVGLELARTPFYEKELTIRFARSYGPGRYDLSYETWGVDYPPGHVRWTEGRNGRAILDLLSTGSLRLSDLVTHSFSIADAARAYELIRTNSEPHLGVQLICEADADMSDRPITLKRRSAEGDGIGLVGAGAFARLVLLPAFQQAGFSRFVSVSSASGLSARHLAERADFEKVVSGPEDVMSDTDVSIVIIATPHESHARLTVEALRAGKHVFCEKPLALSMKELEEVETALAESGRVLFVGFNRRWSKPVGAVKQHFAGVTSPLTIDYRVSAGSVPPGHWYNDRRNGGRLIGEVCHFIDTCAAILGKSALDVHAFGSLFPQAERGDDVVMSLSYDDGSLASITYASGGHEGDEKERIDIFGGGHSASVIDFRQLIIDGRRSKIGSQDKGHVDEVAAFRQSIFGGIEVADWPITSTATTLNAVACITTNHRE